MTGQDLKNSILQLAIQGKLVPQDANDEPASVLLERIKAEKKKLIEEKKIKKEKPLAEITEDEMPFEIPESWVWCRISDISDSYIGLTYRPSDVSENGTVVLRSSNIQNGKIDLNDVVKVNVPITEKLTVHENDILICARNGSSKLVGKSAIITKDADGMSFGAFMAICKTPYSKYVYQYLQSDLFFSQLRQVSGTTTINQLTQKNFNSFLIPLPPLSEQHRIVAKIEELMPLIDEYDKAQKELDALNSAMPEQLKQSLLQEAIMGKLGTNNPDDEPASELLKRIREEKAQLIKEKKIKKEKPLPEITEDEKPFEIPENWEWCRIGDLFMHNNGKQLNKSKQEGIYMDYITTSNLYWDYFLLDNVKQMPFEQSEIERCQAKKGDLLVCEGGDIGRACIWNYDYPIMLQNHIHKLRAYIPLATRYFYYIFYNYNKCGKIGGKGIGIQGLSSNVLHNILIPLPPLAEQHRIVEKLDALLPMISELAKSK